jgi:ubiquinone/menaquinone biosynthesis C-methylase UbiE
MDTRSRYARSFDAVVDQYETGRAGYAPAAIARLTEIFSIGPKTRVLDLAAGSGKLTRLIVPTAAEITAVEPLPQMRSRLIATCPSVMAIDGRAEALPLDDSSQDVVVIGSAFHWFDHEPALREISRVLTDGGGLALLRNPEDGEQGDWHEGLDEFGPRRGRERHPAHSSNWMAVLEQSPLFTDLGEESFPWEVETTVDQYVDRVASFSRLAALPAEEREHTLDQVRAQLEQNLATLSLETFAVRYRSRLTWGWKSTGA